MVLHAYCALAVTTARSSNTLTIKDLCRQAAESKEALDMAKAKEAAAEAKDKEASSKLAGLLAREQAVADHKEQQAAALQATEAADQVGYHAEQHSSVHRYVLHVVLSIPCSGAAATPSPAL